MAKKKLSRPKLAKVEKWDHEDVAELIAWLDYCLKHDVFDFRESVTSHLRRSRGKEYGFSRVETKLKGIRERQLSAPYGRNQTWRDVFTSGSEVLWLRDEEKTSLAQAIARLEDQTLATFLTPERRLRSASRLSGSPLTSKTIFLPVREEYLPKNEQHKREKKRSRSSSCTKRESEPADLAVQKYHPPIKKQRRTLQTSTAILLEERSVRIIEELSHQKSGTPAQHPEEIGFEVFDSEYERSSTAEPDEQRKSAEKIHGQIESRDGDRGAPLQKFDNDRAKIRKLRQKLRASKLKVSRLEGQVTEMQSRKLPLAATPNPRGLGSIESLQAIILQKDQYIKKKIDELKDRRSLGAFTKSLSNSQSYTGKITVKTGFENAYFEIQNILYLQDVQRHIVMPPLDDHKHLRSLLHEGLGVDSFKADEVQLHLSTLSLQAVVRLCTCSALRKWVFESSFPRFGRIPELLVKYRENLAKLDGVTALRNLDLSAHHAIINSDKFQGNVIPKKARKLAKKLSCTLAPLFGGSAEEHRRLDNDGFDTWGHRKKEHEERKHRLVNLFIGALMLKADSVLHSYKYEMDMYKPGMTFNTDTMTVESAEEIPLNGSFGGRTIQICLQAAVFSYPMEGIDDNAPEFMAGAMVSSKNFIRSDSQQEKGTLVVPAVVILRDAQLPSLTTLDDGGPRTNTGSDCSTLTSMATEDLNHLI